MYPITTRLSGVSFGGAQKNIKMFGCEDIGTYALVREPKNPHDANAIRVEVAGYFMGYVGRQIARWLAPEMDGGRRFRAEYVGLNKHPYHDIVGLTIRIVEQKDVNQNTQRKEGR
jgi:hypothetical protein